MAKIKTSFECMLCKENLQFPQNCSITQFLMHMLSFYEKHNVCENVNSEPKLEIRTPKKRKKKTG